MTGLELWTQVAIWTLIVGSAVVFAWFAWDLRRFSRSLEDRGPERTVGGSNRGTASSSSDTTDRP